MNKNLTRFGFSLAMGLLFFACNNNPALEKDDQDSEQKLSSIQEKINQLKQEIEDELGQYKQLNSSQDLAEEKSQLGTADQEKLTRKIKHLEVDIRGCQTNLENPVGGSIEEILEEAFKNELKDSQSNLEILKKILEKRIQINNLEKELN